MTNGNSAAMDILLNVRAHGGGIDEAIALLSVCADGGKDSSDARDAERYRKFRLNAYWWGVGNPTPEELDARIDAAIAGEKK